MRTSYLRPHTLALTILAGITRPVDAQSLTGSRPGLPQLSSQSVRWERSFTRDSVRPSEWQKGMIIGGVIGVVLGLLAFDFTKSMSDSSKNGNVSEILVTAGICSLIGGLIGSSSHKT